MPTRAVDGAANRLKEQRADGRHAAAQHDELGMQNADDVGDADAQILCCSRQSDTHCLVALAAACAISRGVTRPGSPPVSSCSRVVCPDSSSRTPSPVMAGPAANVSREQPRLPQLQAGPSGSTVVWPNSADAPMRPRCSRPPMVKPPPMPVPRVKKARLPHACGRGRKPIHPKLPCGHR